MKAAKYDIYTGFSIDRVVGRSVGYMTVTTDRPLKPGFSIDHVVGRSVGYMTVTTDRPLKLQNWFQY